jgi:hypothetical protein
MDDVKRLARLIKESGIECDEAITASDAQWDRIVAISSRLNSFKLQLV